MTDAKGIKASATVTVRVTGAPNQCPTRTPSPTSSTARRWTSTAGPCGAASDNFNVTNGELVLPIDNGSIYQGGTSAGNIITQPTPSGAWTVTAEGPGRRAQPELPAGRPARVLRRRQLGVGAHDLGGRRRASSSSSTRTPATRATGRPTTAARCPANAPLAYYVRIHSDGTNLTASYSFDGDTFTPVGQPAPLSTFSNPQIGPVALSDPAPSKPTAYFDWIRFDPDTGTGGGGGGGGTTVARTSSTAPTSRLRRGRSCAATRR